MLLFQFQSTLHQIQNEISLIIAQLMTVLVLIGVVFVIIREMFHGRVSINFMLRLVVKNFVSRSRLELMYVSLIVIITWSLIHVHGFQLLVLLSYLIEIASFVCINRINLLQVKFRKARSCCKSVLEVAKLVYANKTKESITFQKLDSRNICGIANSVESKCKADLPPLFYGLDVVCCIWSSRIMKSFFKKLNLDDASISLPAFRSKNNSKLHNIHKTPKLVKKVVTNLYSSKGYGSDCIPAVEEIWAWSFTQTTEFFNKCLKEFYFPNCWKVSSVIPVFKNNDKNSINKFIYLVILYFYVDF